jgi:membrane protein required for colicin V production
VSLDELLQQLQRLGWVDLTLLGVLVLSIFVGLWRGFVFEIVSLLGWLVAYVIANLFGPLLAQGLPFGDPASPLRVWVAYVVVFVLVLVACTLLARMLRALVSATPLSAVDRLLGAAFGAARGVAVLVIAATLVALSPFAHSPSWRESHGALWLGQALEALKPVLPQSLNVHIVTT